MPLRRVFACVLLLTALLAPARGGATTCEQPTLAGAQSNADIVVVGRVGKVSPDGLRFAFTVERVHKGTAPPSIEIWAGGMKGAMLTSGTRTLVFLRLTGEPGSQTLFAHLCNNPFGDKQVKEWIQKLGKGAPPSAAGSAPTSGKPGAAALASAAPDPEPPPPAPALQALVPCVSDSLLKSRVHSRVWCSREEGAYSLSATDESRRRRGQQAREGAANLVRNH